MSIIFFWIDIEFIGILSGAVVFDGGFSIQPDSGMVLLLFFHDRDFGQ